MNSGFWSIGKWRGVPVFFHWTILLWIPWYLWQNMNFISTALTFLAFVLLMCVHELGHAIVAKKRHVKVEEIRLFVLHGQCEHEHPYYEEDDVFIAWGGVLAQFVILALALVTNYLLALLSPQAYYILAPLFYVFVNTNIAIATINLIPIQPLDGYRAWRAIPLLGEWLRPKYTLLFQKLQNMLNFKKRGKMKKDSERIVAELLERMKEKK
jgi:stage IV sporulation protein FB